MLGLLRHYSMRIDIKIYGQIIIIYSIGFITINYIYIEFLNKVCINTFFKLEALKDF